MGVVCAHCRWKESVNSSCQVFFEKMAGWRIAVLTLAFVAIDGHQISFSTPYSSPLNRYSSYHYSNPYWQPKTATVSRFHPIHASPVPFYSSAPFSYFGANRAHHFYGHPQAFYPMTSPMGRQDTTTTSDKQDEENDYTDEERSSIVALIQDAFGTPDYE